MRPLTVTVLPTRPLWLAVHEVAEVVADLGVRQQSPVVEHPGHVAIDLDRLPLLDDQRPVEAAADLLETALMRVVPVGAGVGDVELVDEGLARRDRPLGQMRHAVHRVRHAQAVPMDGRLLRELVLDRDAETLALSYPDLRARNRTVVGPDGGLGVRARRRGASAPDGRPDESLRSGQPSAPRPQYRYGCRGAARRQEGTTRQERSMECSHGTCTHLLDGARRCRAFRPASALLRSNASAHRCAGCRRNGSGVSQG